MTNAKNEFLEHLKSREVLCAKIYQQEWDDNFDDKFENCKILKIGYNKEDYEFFLNSLNFKYDSGYGGQELFGNIWYKDGTWSSREEYDGSEWWSHSKCPEIPDLLKN